MTKHKNKLKKTGKKARRAVAKHGPLAALMTALGGLATSVMASKRLRKAFIGLMDEAVARASSALERAQLTSGGNGEHGRKKRHKLGVGNEAHA